MWTLLQYQTVFTDFLAQCDENMQAAILSKVDQLRREGNQARYPLTRYLTNTDGILECRPRAGKQQARLLFYFQPNKRIVFVVAVFKDQRKLDRGAIKLAERRKELIESGQEATDGIDHTH